MCVVQSWDRERCFQEIQTYKSRQEKMKTDFAYNLKLLEERDSELEQYDRAFSEYSFVLKYVLRSFNLGKVSRGDWLHQTSPLCTVLLYVAEKHVLEFNTLLNAQLSMHLSRDSTEFREI